MSDHRYRLPDHIKERQAAKLKKRFAAYGQQGPKAAKQTISNLTKFLVLLVLAYAVYRWRRGN